MGLAHAIQTLPWQHVVVLLEILTSTLFAAYVMGKGVYKRTWRWALFNGAEDVLSVGLFIWGCDHVSWQAITYVLIVVWAVIVGIKATASGKDFVAKHPDSGWATFFLMLWPLSLALLVVYS